MPAMPIMLRTRGRVHMMYRLRRSRLNRITTGAKKTPRPRTQILTR
jgi:hypothetical protein